jgi:hypothetical protein
MLALHGGKEDGSELLLIVLEPGNLAKLKEGQPIHKFLSELLPGFQRRVELVFAYSPDVVWVAEQIGESRDMETVARAIEKSLTRPEVLVRGRSAEEMKRIF